MEKEPARCRPAWAVKYGRFSKTGGPLPVVRRGTVEAQLSSDDEVAWPIGPFLSDSMWENLWTGFNIHEECSREKRDDGKNHS